MAFEKKAKTFVKALTNVRDGEKIRKHGEKFSVDKDRAESLERSMAAKILNKEVDEEDGPG